LKVGLIFILAFPLHSFAQNIDSLISEAEKYKKLGNDFFNAANQDLAKSRINFELAAENYLKADDFDNAVLFYSSVAYIYNQENDFYNYKKTCIKTHFIASKNLKENNPWLIRSLEELNTSHFRLSDYNKSLEILHKVLDLRINKKHNPIDASITALNLANTYKFAGDIENARRYLKLSQIEFEKVEESDERIYYDVALDLYRSKIKLFEYSNQPDSAFYYLDPYLKFASKNASKNYIALAYMDAAEIASKQNETNKAKSYLSEASKIQLVDKFYHVYKLETEAKILAQEGRHKEALTLFDEAHKLAISSDKKNTPSLRSKRLKEMYNSAAFLNDKKLLASIIEEGIQINLLADKIK